MAYIDIVDLNKSFTTQKVLDGLNLSINEGEFLVILGPSGCGKSTLLNIIAGLIKPDRGSIYKNGKIINGLSPNKRNIGMVFQDHSLYPHMTVKDNLVFPLKMRHINKEEIKKRFQEIINNYNLKLFLDKYPSQLSGGERQRIAICKAIIQKPEIFLFDEPLSNIDAKLRVSLRSEIKRTHKNIGSTVIYVTHDQIEALSLSDRLAVINEGKIIQIGKADDLYNSPNTTFIAKFIGTPPINLFELNFSIENKIINIFSSELSFKFTQNDFPFLSKYKNNKILIGIRPEDIKLESSLNTNNHNFYKFKIDFVENLGSDILYHVKQSNLLITIKVSKINKIDSNVIGLSFNPDTFLFFDYQDKTNLNV